MLDTLHFLDRLGAGVGLLRRTADRCSFRASVEAVFRNARGEVTSCSVQRNLRVSKGADYWNAQLFGAASATNIAKNIAITTDAGAPAEIAAALTGLVQAGIVDSRGSNGGLRIANARFG